jgi:hypothetical protein
MWTIWREWNERCFENQKKKLDELKKLFIMTLFHWAAAFNVPQFSTMPQFVAFWSSFHPLVGPFFVYTLCTRVAPLYTFQWIIYFKKIIIIKNKTKQIESLFQPANHHSIFSTIPLNIEVDMYGAHPKGYPNISSVTKPPHTP